LLRQLRNATNWCDGPKGRGWLFRVKAMSGNGAHALYPVSLENTKEVTALYKRAPKALDERFSDERVTVDVSASNASRIWFNLCVDKVSFRFNMTKRAELPSKKALSRSEAERYRDHFRTMARDGDITRRGRPIKSGGKAGDGRTLRQVAE
jgi:hypothetical protein